MVLSHPSGSMRSPYEIDYASHMIFIFNWMKARNEDIIQSMNTCASNNGSNSIEVYSSVLYSSLVSNVSGMDIKD